MHILVLVLAWLTPALIAEMLGWRGVWGGGGAFGDYIIPIPVAGGAMHVPSFVVLAVVVFANRRRTEAGRSFLPLFAFCIAAAGLAAMLDFDRLNSWLFTDYEPSGSPFRFDSNPFFLFVTTDALWAGIYSAHDRQGLAGTQLVGIATRATRGDCRPRPGLPHGRPGVQDWSRVSGQFTGRGDLDDLYLGTLRGGGIPRLAGYEFAVAAVDKSQCRARRRGFYEQPAGDEVAMEKRCRHG